MKPLVNDMVQDDPEKRPTIHEVVSRFNKLRRSLHWWTLRTRLVHEKEELDTRTWHVFRVVMHLIYATTDILAFQSATPKPPKRPLHSFKL